MKVLLERIKYLPSTIPGVAIIVFAVASLFGLKLQFTPQQLIDYLTTNFETLKTIAEAGIGIYLVWMKPKETT